MKKKIIITYTGDPLDAMDKVSQVIMAGKISEARNIKHYCWVTRFPDEEYVYVSTKRSKNSADSFTVF